MKAEWIWAADAPEHENRRACFCDTVMLPAAAESVKIRIVAVNKYVLYVNGNRVGYGSPRNEKGKCIADTYEILPFMHSGRNHLAVHVWDYGWSTYQSLPDEGGLWYEVYMDDSLVSVSDGHVRALVDEGHMPFVPKRNVNLGFGDYYDAEKFNQNWIDDPDVSAFWPGAAVLQTERDIADRTMRQLQNTRMNPRKVISLEEINQGGQTLSINTRHAFWGDRRDADEITINGLIGFRIHAEHELHGRIAFPNRTWNGMLGSFRIGNTVYPVKDRERDVEVTVPAGDSLMLIQLNGKFDDHFCHLEFCLEEAVDFIGFGTDRCCFVIGPTASLVSVTDGVGQIYNDMSPLQEVDEKLFACTSIEELEACGEPLKWVEARYVTKDTYLLSLARMAQPVKKCAVLPQHLGILWNNTEATVIDLPQKGESMRLLVDFGDLYVGNLEFIVRAPAGTRIDIYGFENMYRGEIDYTIGLNNGMRYICREGWQHYRCFARMGLRYAMITISGAANCVQLQQFFINHTTYAYSGTGSFECNDALLNNIWAMCRHTHENCIEDAFTDSPTYEQTYWTGDAQTSAAVNTWVFGDYEFLRHNLVLAKTAFRNSPIGNALTPTDWNTSIPMWTFNWFISFVQYLENSGDRTIVPELYSQIREMLLYYAGLMTEDGGVLISAWNFVDWAPIDYPARCVPTAYQIMLRWCFARFSAIAAEEGMTQDATLFTEIAEKAKRFLNDRLWSCDRNAYYDSWNPETGYGSSFSIQTHIMAVLYGGTEDAEREKKVRSYILNRPEDFVEAGSPFMLYYLYESWAKIGLCDEIFADISKRWGEMIRYETTTCWEVFPGFYENSRTRSYCHSWSTAPAALMQKILLGVKIEAPGFRKVSVCIPETSLRWCRGTIPTPYGMILADWNKDIGKVRLQLPQEIELIGSLPEGFEVCVERTAL